MYVSTYYQLLQGGSPVRYPLLGILTLTTLCRLLVVLPARTPLGPVAYAQFARVSDLGPGRIVDPVMGIGGFALTFAAFGAAMLSPTRRRTRMLLGAATGVAMLVGITTLMAAPTMWRVGGAPDDPAVLSPLLQQFVAWSTARMALNQLVFIVTLAALVLR